MFVLPEHFTPARSRDEARALFARSVKSVEVEVFTYCNRTCWFCPNAAIDRRSDNRYMDEALYLRILSELAEVDYHHVVTYSRYNEPLADRVILTRLRQARQALPLALLSTHTNGDYLTREYMEELCEAGLNRLHVMAYLGNDEEFADDAVLGRMEAKIAQLGLPFEFTTRLPGVRYTARLRHETMTISLDARNFRLIGTDRGKLVTLQPYVRTSPCAIVFEEMYVDWNGRVMPCCNLRSDAPEHQGYVVADLSEGTSIFEAYASSPLVEWRRSLFNVRPKRAPCDSCRHELLDTSERSRRLIERLEAVIVPSE